jgi:hypothetical protein
MSNYFNELRFVEVDDRRLELLMEIVSKNNLEGKKCALSMDSFKEHKFFFLTFLDGAGVIPLSVEKKTSEFVNAVNAVKVINQGKIILLFYHLSICTQNIQTC